MEKFYKTLNTTRIVFCVLTVAFLLLQFVWQPFVYFAIVTGSLVFITLGVHQIISYHELKLAIQDGYETYLEEAYSNGTISKEQFEQKTQDLFPTYEKMYRGDKWKKIGLFLLFFGLAVTLIMVLVKIIL